MALAEDENEELELNRLAQEVTQRRDDEESRTRENW
jgi:hypothetical protein